jgi:hypothetical protein
LPSGTNLQRSLKTVKPAAGDKEILEILEILVGLGADWGAQKQRQETNACGMLKLRFRGIFCDIKPVL